MKSKKTILLAVLLVVLIGAAAVFYQKMGVNLRGDGPTVMTPPAPSSSEAGTGNASSAPEQQRIPVPEELSFTDSDGNTVTLGDLRGKPVVLNFWATWCGYCRKEMPDFVDVSNEFGDRVQFVMLNVGETRETANDFLQKNGFDTLPVYYDDLDRQVSWAFGVSGFPMTFFIDGEGVIAAYEPGMTTAERLRTGIGMILTEGEPQVTASETAAASPEEVVNPSWCTMEAVYTKIDPENAKSLMDESAGYQDFYLVDVRTEAEYQEKHIPGAMLLPLDELADRAETEFPDKRSLILVYCRSGRRSEEAAKKLVDMGYNHVYDFGGINDWPYDTVAGS